MPIPLGTPEPGVVVAPKLNPWEAYQAALSKYQQTYQPTVTPQYEAYGQAPSAPTAAQGPGLGALVGLKLAMSGGGSAAAPGLAGALGSSIPGTAGSLINTTAGLKGATLGASQVTPAATGVLGTGLGAAPLAGIGLAGILAGKAGYDMFKGKKPNLPGRVVLGMATGGLSEVAKATGLLGHKSTKDYQRERWGNLGESTHAPTQAYANQYLDYLGSDQAKTDALYENTFDAKKAAGTLGGKDVWGGLGMFKTFGDDWLGKYTEDQRLNISNELIKQNLLGNSKGDITIIDPTKAKEIAAGTIAQMLTAKPVNNPNSPGFKDGKRINYGSKSR